MSLNVPMARRLVRRALGGRAVFWEQAEREWIIWPAATATIAPALFPSGAIEKIRALSPWRKWATEERLIHGGTIELPATRACLLRDVDIVDGHLYCRGAVAQEGYGKQRLWLRDTVAPLHLERANLVSTFSGTHFFGCLLLDDFPQELLGADPADSLSISSKPSGHEAGYRELMDLGPKRQMLRGCVRALTHFSDPAHNASKAERYRVLRERLRRHVPSREPGATDKLYIRRGLSGERRVMANEPEVETVLQARGYTVIDPMQMQAADIARASLDARVVVSIEGSQISHAQFSMADDAALAVIQPPDRFGMQYKQFADCLDMRFGFVVADACADGFRVDIGELLALLDRLEQPRAT